MDVALWKSKGITINDMLDSSNLKWHTRWIRDTLDPHIARDGPEAVSVEDALYMDQFLRKLLLVTLSVQDIRVSRIHIALLDITRRSTRWPHGLIERAEAVVKAWEAKIGKLSEVGTELLGPGGRLDGIATAAALVADNLLMTWLKQGVRLLPARARRWGDLGFKPGDWWINTLFAFRDGIIDFHESNGGIVSDNNGAYAIVLADTDELTSSTADTFTYRSHAKDKGRYRLTSASRESRQPVRVLRSHTLRSFWSPRAGIRYDGLYRVVGWSIHHDAQTKAFSYDISFQRLQSESSMDAVLQHPFTDEIEDYKEYKRLKHTATTAPAIPSKLAKMGIPTFALTMENVPEEGLTSLV